MTHALNARPGAHPGHPPEELLIDAEVDDEPAPPAPPLRPWLLLLGLVLVALNLRPALSSLAPAQPGTRRYRPLGRRRRPADHRAGTLPGVVRAARAAPGPAYRRRTQRAADPLLPGRRHRPAQPVPGVRPVRRQRPGRRQHRHHRRAPAGHRQTRLPAPGRGDDRGLHHGPVPEAALAAGATAPLEKLFGNWNWRWRSGRCRRSSPPPSGCRRPARASTPIARPSVSSACGATRWPGRSRCTWACNRPWPTSSSVGCRRS